VPQLRVIFARLLHRPSHELEEILEEVNDVLRRNEEARIHHWLTAHGKFPPSRRKPHL
jgi:endonuclease III